MKKRNNFKIQKSNVGTLLIGVAFSFGVLIVTSLIFSFILIGLKNPTGSIKTASLAVFLITAAIAGFSVSKYKGNGGALLSILTSAAFIFILLAVTLISSKGKVGGGIFMNYICYIMISAFTAFLAGKRKKRRKR